MSLPDYSSDSETTTTTTGTKLIYLDFDTNNIGMNNRYIKTVTGLNAIKQRIIKIFKTDKRISKIYSDSNFGINRSLILGQEYYSNISSVETVILDLKSQILDLGGVNSITGFETSVEGSQLIISCTVSTDYGTLEVTA